MCCTCIDRFIGVDDWFLNLLRSSSNNQIGDCRLSDRLEVSLGRCGQEAVIGVDLAQRRRCGSRCSGTVSHRDLRSDNFGLVDRQWIRCICWLACRRGCSAHRCGPSLGCRWSRTRRCTLLRCHRLLRILGCCPTLVRCGILRSCSPLLGCLRFRFFLRSSRWIQDRGKVTEGGRGTKGSQAIVDRSGSSSELYARVGIVVLDIVQVGRRKNLRNLCGLKSEKSNHE